MAKIIVQKFTETQTSGGKTKYKCIGTIDGELDQFEMFDKPELDQEFEGSVKDDPKWGKTISTGSRGGGSRGGGRSPEERSEIIRQNALTNAVNRAIAVAGLMDSQEARLNTLKPENIMIVALKFARFSQTPAKAIDDEQAAAGPEPDGSEDINPSEIPF